MLSERTKRKLEGIETCSRNGRYKVQDLFKIALECPDLWEQAYANIHSNNGAMTAGVDGHTIDGHSEERIKNLVKLLKENRYIPNPLKRVYIPKANGKTRPLGIPSINDKLIQEVWRILLEQIYEPIFHRDSHGFRHDRSCHTALEGIRRHWNGTKWFIEFDIEGYFDNIDHSKMIQLLEKRINDKKFLSIIKRMLKAGYVENWKFNKTYSGTPQGGIISPILANIYLHEFDEFVVNLQESYTKGKFRKDNPEYKKIKREKEKLSNKIRKAQKQEDQILAKKLITDWKELGKTQRSIPSKDPNDPHYKRLWYTRYADDFAFGFIGSKEEARDIENQVSQFLKTELKLNISPEKSGIKHSSEGINFLGYDVLIKSDEKVLKVKWHGRSTLKRTMKENIQLRVPIRLPQKFNQGKRYGHWNSHKATHRPELLNNSDVEIVLQYNAEMRGITNYYALDKNVKRAMNKLVSLARLSLFKTLANKHKNSVQKVCKWLDQGSYKAMKHNGKEYKIFRTKDIIKPHRKLSVDSKPLLHKYNGRTELVARMNANVCEYCGESKGYFEVHHIRKMKDIKDGKADWQKHMIARNRKTMVLCAGHKTSCHTLLHAGKLPDRRYFQERMESAMR